MNLLPWREMHRRRQRRGTVLLVVLSVLCMLVVVIVMHLYLVGQLSRRRETNRSLRARDVALTATVKRLKTFAAERHELIKRLKAAKDTTRHNSVVIRLLVMLGGRLPHGPFLTRIEITKNKVQLNGRAARSDDIERLVERLRVGMEGSRMHVTTRIGGINQEGDGYRFRLFLRLE